MKIIWGVIIAVFAFVLLAIVFGESDESSEAPETEERSDAALACEHFRNIAGDVEEDLLTDEELRDKLKEVDDNAAIAPPNVQASARAMLSATTAGSSRRLIRAVGQMDTACASHGT